MTKVSLLCSILFQWLGNLEIMAKIFLHALSISEKYDMITGIFSNFGGDSQLLHAIKTFSSADFSSFAIE